MVFSKLVVVIIFTLAQSLVGTPGKGLAAVGTLFSGLAMMVLACFAPWMLFRLVHFVGGDVIAAHHQGSAAVRRRSRLHHGEPWPAPRPARSPASSAAAPRPVVQLVALQLVVARAAAAPRRVAGLVAGLVERCREGGRARGARHPRWSSSRPPRSAWSRPRGPGRPVRSARHVHRRGSSPANSQASSRRPPSRVTGDRQVRRRRCRRPQATRGARGPTTRPPGPSRRSGVHRPQPAPRLTAR